MPALAMKMSSLAERGGDVFGERGYVLVARGVAHAGEDAEGGVDAVQSGGEAGRSEVVHELMGRPLAKAREMW